MEQIYELIEKKIKEAGYERDVDGRQIYEEICDGIEDKENGTYIFMCKKEDDVVFEYNVQIFDDEFNLSTLTINDGGKLMTIDFDS